MSAPDYSHTDAYAQGYDDGLRAARQTTPSEAVSFPASAHPGEPCPDAGGEHPHPHDVRMTFGSRSVLRAIARGEQPPPGLTACKILIGGGLVALEGGCRYVATADGRAYLAAHDEARTRRTERPARPAVPERWSYSCEVEAWVYEGRLADAVLEDPGPDDLEADLERAEAQVALLRYLRASQAYARASARIGADPAEAGDAASSQTLSGGGGESESARSGESDLCPCESAACPYAGES